MNMNGNGVTHDEHAYLAALDRMRSAPTTLTQADFVQLEAVNPTLVTQAHELRRIALLSRVPSSAALITKSAEPAAPEGRKKPNTRIEASKKRDAILIKVIGATLREKFGEHMARIAALEQRVKELEARPALKHCGIWIEGQPYSEGNLITRGGSLWLAIGPTPGTPGTPGSNWQLIVKSGDAR